MNDLQLLKEEIYNCGLVAPLLESLGCELNPSSFNKDRIEASLPDGDNSRSVQVYLNESLVSRIRTRAHIPIRDIIDIVSYLKFNKQTAEELDRCVGKSKRYIINTLNLTQFNSSQNMQDDPNDWLKKIKNKRKKRISLSEIEPNPILPESVFKEFVMKPHQMFVDDGITLNTQREFEIGMDIQTERIVFPIRNINGDVIGIKGRATRPEDEDQYKYMPIYAFQKSKEWFNLHRAMPYILDKNEVICFESEKSNMKAHQMKYFNTVSQMGLEITPVQAAILKSLSPEIKIILAYDKGIAPDEIQAMAKIFGNYNHIYAIVDTKNLLENKEAPVDKGLDVWETLYSKHCFKVFPNK